MKHTQIALFTIATLFSTLSLAAYSGPGSTGGKAATAVVNTVQAAKSAADDTPAVLEGYIVKQLHDEHHEFRDATGSIQVDIDDQAWPQDVAITEKTRVRLHGEVDRDNQGNEIDVNRVEILQ